MKSDKRLVKEIVGAATCMSLANRHLEKIRALAPSMGGAGADELHRLRHGDHQDECGERRRAPC